MSPSAREAGLPQRKTDLLPGGTNHPQEDTRRPGEEASLPHVQANAVAHRTTGHVTEDHVTEGHVTGGHVIDGTVQEEADHHVILRVTSQNMKNLEIKRKRILSEFHINLVPVECCCLIIVSFQSHTRSMLPV